MSEYHFEPSEPTTFYKGEEFLAANNVRPTLVLIVSYTCRKSKSGAVLRTESTAVMTNDITGDKRLF